MKRIVAFLLAVLCFFAIFFGWFDRLNKSAEDLLYHNAGGVTEKIKIIKIDDRSINVLGDYGSWNREMYANLVDILCVSEEIKPAVIGFDLLFDSGGDSEEDAVFAQACADHGNVVCGFSYVFERAITITDNGALDVNNTAISDVIMPYKELYDATKHGFVNALMDDDDGFIRNAFYSFCDEDGVVRYSFDAAV